jgi:hypothetical protein
MGPEVQLLSEGAKPQGTRSRSDTSVMISRDTAGLGNQLGQPRQNFPRLIFQETRGEHLPAHFTTAINALRKHFKAGISIYFQIKCL